MSPRRPLALPLALVAALAPRVALAQHHRDDESAAAAFTARELLRGWEGATNPWYIADALVVLGVAALLGAVLGYHPQVRRKAWSLEQLDQPKTFIFYALVGALSAMVAREDRNMAYVIFGIGGLMRFRTDVGEAKDTGRVLLATMIGVLVGLKLMPVALLTTGFAWVLIGRLERSAVQQLLVQGIDREHASAATEAYRQTLTTLGCRIVGARKNVLKGMFQITFRAPEGFDHEAAERTFEASIAKEHRGAIDWETR